MASVYPPLRRHSYAIPGQPSHIWRPTMISCISFFNMLWLYWFWGDAFPFGQWQQTFAAFMQEAALPGQPYTWLHPPSFPGFVRGLPCGASASVLAIMTTAAVISPDRRINLFLLGSVKLKWITIGCIVLTFSGLRGNPGSQAARYRRRGIRFCVPIHGQAQGFL